MVYQIMEYCCFGKKVRKEKQLIKAIEDNVLELSTEEVEHLNHVLIRKHHRTSLVVASFIESYDMTTLVIDDKFIVYSIC